MKTRKDDRTSGRNKSDILPNWKRSDEFYRDMCVLIMILLARLQYGTLGWYDAYRWGSAERRWSCEHNWVFHTPPSKFTPSLSLSLSLSLGLVRESCSKWTICSICSKINYVPCRSQQKMVSGICKKCLKDREKCVNPKERELMSVGRDKKKKQGNIKKHFIKETVQPTTNSFLLVPNVYGLL